MQAWAEPRNPADVPFQGAVDGGFSQGQGQPAWHLLTAAPSCPQDGSGAPDRPPDEQENDRSDRCGDQIAPEIRHDLELQLFEQEPADNRAHKTHRKVAHLLSALGNARFYWL